MHHDVGRSLRDACCLVNDACCNTGCKGCYGTGEWWLQSPLTILICGLDGKPSPSRCCATGRRAGGSRGDVVGFVASLTHQFGEASAGIAGNGGEIGAQAVPGVAFGGRARRPGREGCRLTIPAWSAPVQWDRPGAAGRPRPEPMALGAARRRPVWRRAHTEPVMTDRPIDNSTDPSAARSIGRWAEGRALSGPGRD